jgi:hypothetical protein
MHKSTTISHLEQRPTSEKGCGHLRHVGTCGCCQRAQLARWSHQLEQCRAPRRGFAHP